MGEDRSRNSLPSKPDQQKDSQESNDEVAIRPVINFNLGGLDLQFNPIAEESKDKDKRKQKSQDIKEKEVTRDIESESERASSDEDGGEAIDMLIVCKIENEFGYPEQYITSCLKKGIKNDATTCYYLFLKEDKHEIVNLLAESPQQPLR